MIAHKLPSPTNFIEAHAAVVRIMKPGKTYILQHFHDDDCPAIKTSKDRDCASTCRPDVYLLELEPGETVERAPDGGQFVAFGKVELQ